MLTPVLLVAKVRCHHLDGLDETLSVLRRGLSKLRLSKPFRERSAVGWIEPLFLSRTAGWLPHAHVVVDVDDDLEHGWESEAAAAFAKATEGAGQLTFPDDDRIYVDPVASLRLARYIVKPKDWCPPPGSMDLDVLEILLDALKGRQLMVAWGVTRRGKNAALAGPPGPAV